MTNTELLENTIKEKGVKKKKIAECLKISPYGLSLKINNETEFKASEIYKIADILSLTPIERDAIFFD